MADRKITVTEGDKTIYEGPENRHLQNVALLKSPKMFGLDPDTWIKIAGFALAIVLFYYRTDEFMKSQTEINRSQTNINDYVMKFVKNSDTYHSSVTGRQFEQGRPFEIGMQSAYASTNKDDK